MEPTLSKQVPGHEGFSLNKVTREIDIETRDGLNLHGWQVEAQGGQPRGNLIILHGMKDYSERYLDFAHKLSQVGYQVFAFDMRGFGRSDGERNYFAHIEDNQDDLNRAFKAFKKYDNNQPWFIMGHSAGGNIIARYAIDNQIQLDGFILTAPFLKRMPDLNDFLVGALKVVDLVAPHAKMIDLPDKNFSKDSAVVRDLAKDPLINHDKLPARTGLQFIKNAEYIEDNRSVVNIPFLVLHGENDLINNIEGSREFFDKTKNIPGKELKTYPGLFHDIHHEPEQAQVQNDIITWLNAMTTKH